MVRAAPNHPTNHHQLLFGAVMIDAQPLQDLLQSLIVGHYGNLTISYNEQANDYQTAKYAVECGEYLDCTDWVSEEEKQAAIETNSIWTLHYYPDTPIGFCSISASSLTAIVQYLERQKPTS